MCASPVCMPATCAGPLTPVSSSWPRTPATRHPSSPTPDSGRGLVGVCGRRVWGGGGVNKQCISLFLIYFTFSAYLFFLYFFPLSLFFIEFFLQHPILLIYFTFPVYFFFLLFLSCFLAFVFPFFFFSLIPFLHDQLFFFSFPTNLFSSISFFSLLLFSYFPLH